METFNYEFGPYENILRDSNSRQVRYIKFFTFDDNNDPVYIDSLSTILKTSDNEIKNNRIVSFTLPDVKSYDKLPDNIKEEFFSINVYKPVTEHDISEEKIDLYIPYKLLKKNKLYTLKEETFSNIFQDHYECYIEFENEVEYIECDPNDIWFVYPSDALIKNKKKATLIVNLLYEIDNRPTKYFYQLQEEKKKIKQETNEDISVYQLDAINKVYKILDHGK